MSFIDYFETELGFDKKCPLTELEKDVVRKSLVELDSQEHSGFSASFLIGILRNILKEVPVITKPLVEAHLKVKGQYWEPSPDDIRFVSTVEDEIDFENLMKQCIKGVIDLLFLHPEINHKVVLMYTIRAFSFKPLSALTGEEDEWMEISDDCKQNKRCSSVFLNNGVPSDIDKIFFRRSDGTCFTKTGPGSEVNNITFPYVVPDRYEKRDAETGAVISEAQYFTL
jgi:hypothetical protein